MYNMSDVPLVRSLPFSIPFSSSPTEFGVGPTFAYHVTNCYYSKKQGFGVTARSTLDTRKLEPTGIIVFHQADVGEFLRDEDTMF